MSGIKQVRTFPANMIRSHLSRRKIYSMREEKKMTYHPMTTSTLILMGIKKWQNGCWNMLQVHIRQVPEYITGVHGWMEQIQKRETGSCEITQRINPVPRRFG